MSLADRFMPRSVPEFARRAHVGSALDQRFSLLQFPTNAGDVQRPFPEKTNLIPLAEIHIDGCGEEFIAITLRACSCRQAT